MTALPIIAYRHILKGAPFAVILFLSAVIVENIVLNPRFEWPLVASYLFAPAILKGLLTTIILTGVCMAIGIMLGVVMAICRMADAGLISGFARLYIWFFRGTPILVQLIFWYNLAALFPSLSLGVPFTSITFITGSTNAIITPYAAAILGLALNEGAYMAEIVRAGLLAVDRGQNDAARALGMGHLRIIRRIILPQAMRIIMPPTGNETHGMLKMTSLVSVIALSDLLYSAQSIYSRTFETIPLLIVCCCWYLFLTTLLSLGQGRIESYFGRGVAAAMTRK